MNRRELIASTAAAAALVTSAGSPSPARPEPR